MQLKALLLIFILTASNISAVSQQKNRKVVTTGTVEVIQRVRPSVVQIYVRAGSETVVLGTGFIVSMDGHIITADHVVNTKQVFINSKDANGNIRTDTVPVTMGHMRVGIPMPDLLPEETGGITIRQGFNGLQFDLIDRDLRHDLAILKCKQNLSNLPVVAKINEKEIRSVVGIARMKRGSLKDGEQILISGYPLQSKTLITTVGHVASASEVNVAEVLIDPPNPQIPRPITRLDFMDIYLGDITANPGNSGGPAYLASTGEIIGILSGGKLNSGVYAGLAIVVPIKYAIDLLKKNKVALQ